MVDNNRVRKVIQYALCVAGQADEFFERELSPIHLIKYLYLADMDYAKFHDGQTFTGLDWTFHHFGPWSLDAFQQLEGALAELGAKKTTFQSDYGDKDFIRWSVDCEDPRCDWLKQALPLDVRSSVQDYVRRFHNNTTSLLHFVYATPPMLSAAPEERLDFSVVVSVKAVKKETHVPFVQRLPESKKRALVEGMAELRKRFTQTIVHIEARPPRMTGRVDSVFEEGAAWLDGLAGEPFPEQGATVHFSDDVWKSGARSGNVEIS